MLVWHVTERLWRYRDTIAESASAVMLRVQSNLAAFYDNGHPEMATYIATRHLSASIS
jgi:hypothetical protein